MIRIRCEPTFELRANLPQVRRIPTQAERLRQQYEMLVAIRLPDHFVIAAAPGVQVRNPAEISKAGLDSTGMIAPPRNFGARINGHPEDRKAMLSNLLRQGENLRGKCSPLKRCCNWRRIGKL